MRCTCLRKLVNPKHVCEWHAWKAAKHARAATRRTVRNRMRHLRRRLESGREPIVYIEARRKVLASRGYMQPLGLRNCSMDDIVSEARARVAEEVRRLNAELDMQPMSTKS